VIRKIAIATACVNCRRSPETARQNVCQTVSVKVNSIKIRVDQESWEEYTARLDAAGRLVHVLYC
jgi:hypothetical protein